MQLLRDVPQLESAGVVVRMPAAFQPAQEADRQPLTQGRKGAGVELC